MSWYWSGIWDGATRLSSPAAIVMATAGFPAARLVNYWAHVLFHKVPALWAFHRVHHSVEVLTPAAAYRIHPVEIIGFAMLQAPAVGSLRSSMRTSLVVTSNHNDFRREYRWFVPLCWVLICAIRMVSYGPVFNRLS